MKIQFNTEDQLVQIEAGTVERFSSYEDGFRLELRCKRHDLAEVERTLVGALSLFRSMKRLMETGSTESFRGQEMPQNVD